MKLNEEKIECMKVHCDHDIMNDSGVAVKCTASLKYLGALIANDGKHSNEKKSPYWSRQRRVQKSAFLLEAFASRLT